MSGGNRRGGTTDSPMVTAGWVAVVEALDPIEMEPDETEEK